MLEGDAMSVAENVRYELDGRLTEAGLGKRHVSVRFEPGPRIIRAGVALANYSWETRMVAIEALVALEDGHEDEFAVEFDVIPLEALNDADHAVA